MCWLCVWEGINPGQVHYINLFLQNTSLVRVEILVFIQMCSWGKSLMPELKKISVIKITKKLKISLGLFGILQLLRFSKVLALCAYRNVLLVTKLWDFIVTTINKFYNFYGEKSTLQSSGHFIRQLFQIYERILKSKVCKSFDFKSVFGNSAKKLPAIHSIDVKQLEK